MALNIYKTTILCSLMLFMLFVPIVVSAQTVGFPQLVTAPFVSGLAQPVHITHSGDGSARLFLVEQLGRIRIVRNGALLPEPFLDIRNRVSCCGERGLLSVAFPPSFATTGRFYVNYTDLSGNTVVARYRLTADPDRADPSSEEVILRVTQPFANHNGGQLAFGPDGFLYVGMGDGGSGGDPNNFAQNLTPLPGNQRLLGKLLRLDVEAGAVPYAIPVTNPLIGGARSEIWALGLRNPWRFSFDRLTGDLFIGDVGQNAFEEINFRPSASGGGENYGWRLMEGAHCFNPPAGCNDGSLTLPVFEYSHAEGCSVTGGFVYRGRLRGPEGIYLHGDFCTGRIRGLKNSGGLWQDTLLLDTAFGITTFGEDQDGELYVSDWTNGTVSRLRFVAPLPSAQQVFTLQPRALPVMSTDPATSEPIGFGSFMSGGATLGLRIALAQFSSAVDVYLGIYAPSVDPTEVYLLSAQGTLSRVSAGLVRWKRNLLDVVDEMPFGEVPLSILPKGTYTFYVAVAPSGRTDTYAIWTAEISIQ